MEKLSINEEAIKQFMDCTFYGKDKDKIALFMVGGPGSGKTTAKQVLLAKLYQSLDTFVNVDVDNVLSKLFSDPINDVKYHPFRGCSSQVPLAVIKNNIKGILTLN